MEKGPHLKVLDHLVGALPQGPEVRDIPSTLH